MGVMEALEAMGVMEALEAQVVMVVMGKMAQNLTTKVLLVKEEAKVEQEGTAVVEVMVGTVEQEETEETQVPAAMLRFEVQILDYLC
jgi:hypothetical protein